MKFSFITIILGMFLLSACSEEKAPPPDYKVCVGTLKTDKTKAICWESTSFAFDENDDADDYCQQALGQMLERDPAVNRAEFSFKADESCSTNLRVECDIYRSDPNNRIANDFFLYGGLLPLWCEPVK